MLLPLFLLLIALITIWYIEDRRKYNGYPPGPLRLPLLGNLVQLALQPSKLPSTALCGLARTYGNLILVRMGAIDFGRKITVVFSSFEVIKELMNMAGIDNRKVFKYMEERSEGGNVGLITSNGNSWNVLRRFSIRTLRDFGFGKSSSMDIVINEEAAKFTDYLKKDLGSRQDKEIYVESGDMFDSTAINILWRLVTGKTYALNDERITKMLRLSGEYVRSARVDDISICYPVLRDWFPKMTGQTVQHECTKNLKEFLEEVIQEHIDEGSFRRDPKSFIDMFLKKIQEEKENANEDATDFNHTQCVYTLLDLFQAGSETTSKTLTFVLLHLIRNPELQEILYNEIDKELGKQSDSESTYVTSLAKSRFPFVEAVILETLRYNAVVPIPAPYECHHDLNFRGYKIPKGTPLLVNLESIHFQESIWGDPQVFRPQRFIKPDGTLDTKLAEYVTAFGKGKRICLGETLAGTTLFIYVVTVIKAFKFEKAETKPLPSVVAKVGLTYSPEPFWTKVVLR